MKLIEWAKGLSDAAILVCYEGGVNRLKHPFQKLECFTQVLDDYDSERGQVILKNDNEEYVGRTIYPYSYGGYFTEGGWKELQKKTKVVETYE